MGINISDIKAISKTYANVGKYEHECIVYIESCYGVFHLSEDTIYNLDMHEQGITILSYSESCLPSCRYLMVSFPRKSEKLPMI